MLKKIKPQTCLHIINDSESCFKSGEVMQQKMKVLFSSILVSVILLACEGETILDQNGRVSLMVTDAPVDDAEAVVVEFSSVILKRDSGEDIAFTFDTPKSINLLALQGNLSQPLLENVEVPAGQYNQIRLGVNAEFDNKLDSYITINGASYELRVPSGSQSGLKLNTPFTVAAGTLGISVADSHSIYTIDFDLRKSIVKPNGQPGYFLKPVLRLIQNVNTGSISGSVNPGLMTGSACSDQDPLTGNAVYIYSGQGITPDDIDAAEPEPVTSALVHFNQSSGLYRYEIGYLSPGNYTIAFTCSADLDDDTDNANVVFVGVGAVTVTAGDNTVHDIN